MSKYSTRKALAVIRSVGRVAVLRYLDYWDKIKPTGSKDYYLRWVFAFMSIRTRWTMNVKGFNAIKRLGFNYTENELKLSVRKLKLGLEKSRIKGIWSVRKAFDDGDPDFTLPDASMGLVALRNRLVDKVFGIGKAKVSFVLEMTLPQQCDVVCLDTHIKQLYGLTGDAHLSDRNYGNIERHWTETCKEYGYPSPMVRHIYWDSIQKESNTRYWSHVLEKPHVRHTQAHKHARAA